MVMMSDALRFSGLRAGNRSGWWLLASAWVVRLVITVVFFAAAIPKIIDPAGFALSVHRYQLLPLWMEAPVAIIVPWLEIVLALSLLTSRNWRMASAILTVMLMLAFTGMVAWAWFHHLNIDCGCFSTDASGQTIGLWHFVRNGLLIAAAGWSLYVDARTPCSLTAKDDS